MTSQDILKAIGNVAALAAFVCLAIFGKMPWEIALLASAATVMPSALPGIMSALAVKKDGAA